jgi:hypothetical protein
MSPSFPKARAPRMTSQGRCGRFREAHALPCRRAFQSRLRVAFHFRPKIDRVLWRRVRRPPYLRAPRVVPSAPWAAAGSSSSGLRYRRRIGPKPGRTKGQRDRTDRPTASTASFGCFSIFPSFPPLRPTGNRFRDAPDEGHFGSLRSTLGKTGTVRKCGQRSNLFCGRSADSTAGGCIWPMPLKKSASGFGRQHKNTNASPDASIIRPSEI